MAKTKDINEDAATNLMQDVLIMYTVSIALSALQVNLRNHVALNLRLFPVFQYGEALCQTDLLLYRYPGMTYFGPDLGP